MAQQPEFRAGPDLGDLRVVGDELHFDGELVAVLVTTCSATSMGRFTDLIEFPDGAEGDCGCPPRLHKKECDHHKAEDGEPEDPEYTKAEQHNDVMRRARELAHGGLVRLVDLEKEFGK